MTTMARDPRLDPRSGDELLAPDGTLYKVAGIIYGKTTSVRVERQVGRTVKPTQSVSLDAWRALAAGFEVEFVSGGRS